MSLPLALLLLGLWVIPPTSRMILAGRELRDDFGYLVPWRVDRLRQLFFSWLVRLLVGAALLTGLIFSNTLIM